MLSARYCLLTGRMFAGCACVCVFGCSVCAPLAFPFLLACLLGARVLVGLVFALLVARKELL